MRILQQTKKRRNYLQPVDLLLLFVYILLFVRLYILFRIQIICIYKQSISFLHKHFLNLNLPYKEKKANLYRQIPRLSYIETMD